MGQAAREPKYNLCFRARNKRAELGKCDWDSKVNQEPNGGKKSLEACSDSVSMCSLLRLSSGKRDRCQVRTLKLNERKRSKFA